MQLHQKRQISSNAKKEQEETPHPQPSTANTSATNNDVNSPEPEAAQPPKKRMTLDASAVPVAQEKQPEPVNIELMNDLMQMQDLVNYMENYDQFKKGMDWIQKHGTHNFMVNKEFADKMKEIFEKMGALNAVMPKSVHIQPIQKRIQMIIKNGREQLFTKDEFYDVSTPIDGEAEHEQNLTNFCSWASNSMEDQSNDRNGLTSSGSSSSTNSQVPMLMPKMPITPKPQFDTRYPVFYPPPFGHPTSTQFPVPSCSTGHLPMPIYLEIIKDIKRENSEDAIHNIYRNCLVCGDNNYACGKYTGTGLQVCKTCRKFFKRMVEFGNDKKTDTFKCSEGCGNCLISKETRTSCQFCRFQACLKAGMDRQKTVQLKVKREKKNGSGNDNCGGVEEVELGNGCEN